MKIKDLFRATTSEGQEFYLSVDGGEDIDDPNDDSFQIATRRAQNMILNSPDGQLDGFLASMTWLGPVFDTSVVDEMMHDCDCDEHATNEPAPNN